MRCVVPACLRLSFGVLFSRLLFVCLPSMSTFFLPVCVIQSRPGLKFNCCGNATYEPLQNSSPAQIGFSIELVSPSAESHLQSPQPLFKAFLIFC